DTSASMQALDLDADVAISRRRTRLQVVKDVVGAFVERRPNDQLGMVVFGAEAFTQCPLTLDHDVFRTLLQGVATGMAGDTTAIGSGLAAASNRLRRSAAKSKVIVLLTDGSNNAGSLSPKRAAELSRALGIKVHTIGAANRGKAPFLVNTILGKEVHYGEFELDETTLKDIASITGGTYFRAEDSHALADIYTKIDAMEKTDLKKQQFREYEEHFAPLVWAALLLLLVETIGLQTRLRAYP
ncbi:MAG: VWA domain-containing protein, partial [Deltaproteobacteria bacterium]